MENVYILGIAAMFPITTTKHWVQRGFWSAAPNDGPESWRLSVHQKVTHCICSTRLCNVLSMHIDVVPLRVLPAGRVFQDWRLSVHQKVTHCIRSTRLCNVLSMHIDVVPLRVLPAGRVFQDVRLPLVMVNNDDDPVINPSLVKVSFGDECSALRVPAFL
jgi:hypothetical protein